MIRCRRNAFRKEDAIAVMNDRERDGSVMLQPTWCDECAGYHLDEREPGQERFLTETTDTIPEV